MIFNQRGIRDEMKKRTAFTAAAVLLVTALFLKTCLVGYSFLALVLCAFAVACLLLVLLPGRWRKAFCILLALWFIVFLSAEVCVIRDAS